MKQLARKVMVFIAFALILATAACTQSETTQKSVDLKDTSWKLVQLNSKPTIADVEITIDFSEQSFTGSAGCNRYGGSYVADQNLLMIEDLGGTDKLCEIPAGVMQQEQFFTATLTQVTSYQVTGNLLMLKNSSGNTVLEFSSK